MMLASHLVRNIASKFLVSPASHSGLSVLQKAGISGGKQILYQQFLRLTTDLTRCSLHCTTTRCSPLLSKRISRFTQSCLYSCMVRDGPNRLVFLQAKLAVPMSWENGIRLISAQTKRNTSHNSIMLYVFSTVIFMIGMSYAGVPLYRLFCQATGLGGKAVREENAEKISNMSMVDDRIIRVRFNADVASSMRWNFRPQQTEVKVHPGETALAFYTARNPTPNPIIGISTYNVIPFEAGQYFNKIQCFCFEEQRLNPNEQVDMPVFFYIDPEFAEDPKLQKVDTITLSYTFFEAKEGLKLPLPGYMTS
ncbi:cytochrome c oxidase assembly protein COX11, mitochondrial-like [Gigantopelta aegis]|uniref:cytochrome c oxidase assembly protein COX11, mitochondrial-like n=1 Tax=Gigantopelta aegis TaxID=1735272 RepID=UPI001B88E4D5|nr:cytochrome c oxidase assembly protein COX11, mitochondrial-like [Gigantopelta aegis]XP_041362511.1 cytochrome c oxidase assembly protein COX11, mitochondrial-like [Gigantopelta aegis]